MPKPLTNPNTYKTLVNKISKELSDLEFFIKRRTAETYWKIGKFIHDHLLENKERADYGSRLFELLAEDVDRDASTLQKMLRFYRAYPILADRPELTWSHYRVLSSVQDEEERKKLEKQIIDKDWDSTDLEEYLRKRREFKKNLDDKDGPAAQLPFTRGKLNVCRLVSTAAGEGFLLDLGFRIRREFSEAKALRLKENDCVEIIKEDGKWILKKIVETHCDASLLFTYQAQIVKVVDGDTLKVNIDAGFGIFVEQKLRLKGIDCPEIDTEEGQKAKRFVQSRLNKLNFIIIKTHKDSTDKYDRYLADIFYLPEESDPSKAAQQGSYLNQDLLNERLAVVYE